MPDPVQIRGSTVSFSFTFRDAAGDVVDADSATLTLVYPGLKEWQKASVALTDTDDVWTGTWDSAVTRPAWVEYHAHALDGSTEHAIDGRFKVSGNRAAMQHDKLAQGSGAYDETVE